MSGGKPGERRGPLRIAWLTTGRGPGSYGALEYLFGAIRDGLPVQVAAVFVNRAPGEAEPTDRLMDLVGRQGVPLETLSSVAFRRSHGGNISRPGEPLPPWRHAYDEAVARALSKYDFQLAVMFGYMLIATEPLFRAFPIINDHPALPDGPVGTYQEVIAELIRTRARQSGCMVNVVTGDVDRGPAVSFCRYPIRDDANERAWRDIDRAWALAASAAELEATALYADIRARGVARERPFMAETLRAIGAGLVTVPPGTPLDLTGNVQGRLTGSSPGKGSYLG